MKHLKLFIASLFLMLGMAVHAQQVEITKNDGTVEVFKPNEVDSVVYKPAPKYYYYAGWECPKTEEDLAELVANAGKESISNPGYPTSFGVTKTSNTGFTATNPFGIMSKEIDDSDYMLANNYNERYCYVVVPTNMGVYDADDVTVSQIGPSFIQDTTNNIPNHTVYKSKNTMGMCAKMIVYNK